MMRKGDKRLTLAIPHSGGPASFNKANAVQVHYGEAVKGENRSYKSSSSGRRPTKKANKQETAFFC